MRIKKRGGRHGKYVSKKMKRIFAIVLSILMLFSMVGCSGSEKPEASGEQKEPVVSEASKEEETTGEKMEEGYYPITINTGDKELVIEKMPENVAVFNYDIAEIMSALGLSDKITIFRGGHQSLEDILPEYQQGLANLKDTEEIASDKGFPTLESMLNLEPDIIIMPSYYFNVDPFGKKEDYAKNNIPLYIMEGTYIPDCTIENTYHDIMNIGKIFNKEKEATKLVEDMKSRLAIVEKKMEGKEKLKVLGFDMELDGKVVTWGGVGLANNLLELAGGENVFAQTDKQFPHVSWEEIIDADPDIIVIDVYGDDESKGQDKIKALKENPETAELKAVKNDNFITIPLFSIFPGLQNINTIERISDEIVNMQE